MQESRPTGGQTVVFVGRAPESHSRSLWVQHRASQDPRKQGKLDAKFTQNEAEWGRLTLKYKTGFLRRPLAHELQNQEAVPLQFLFVSG